MSGLQRITSLKPTFFVIFSLSIGHNFRTRRNRKRAVILLFDEFWVVIYGDYPFSTQWTDAQIEPLLTLTLAPAKNPEASIMIRLK